MQDRTTRATPSKHRTWKDGGTVRHAQDDDRHAWSGEKAVERGDREGCRESWKAEDGDVRYSCRQAKPNPTCDATVERCAAVVLAGVPAGVGDRISQRDGRFCQG